MRVGVSGGPIPYDIQKVDARLAAKLSELGFTGIATHFGYGSDLLPTQLGRSTCHHARDVLARQGVTIIQAWGWQPNLIHPNADVRYSQVALLAEAIRVAADLGAAMVTCGSGSMNPHGSYYPHPENHSSAAFERLLESLTLAACHAERRGLCIALEPHVSTTLSTPERVRDVIDRVGSPLIRVNLDPVNFVGNLEALYASSQLVERMFSLLGDVAVSGHVKDVYAEDRLVLHLSETIIGDGCFDIVRFLQLFEEALPEGYLFIEHLPEELVPQAKRSVERLAADSGVRCV